MEKNIPQISPRLVDQESDQVEINKLNPETQNPKKENRKLTRLKPRLGLNLSLSKRKKAFILGIGAFGLALVFVFIIFILPVVRGIGGLAASGQALQASIGSQDIKKVKEALGATEAELVSFQKIYQRVGLFRWVPFLGVYYKDGNALLAAGVHGLEAGKILVDTVEPYADIIGFAGSDGQALSGEETANDRIDFIVQTIDDILPRVDDLSQKMGEASNELEKIESKRYPQKIRDFELRSNLEKVIALTKDAAHFLQDGKPLLEAAPYLLGIDAERTYLVLFQNDKELRPTGGFITAYSIARVASGKFEPVVSSDIYNLDGNYRPTIEAADPLVNYLKGPYVLLPKLRLRDMNWSPDFGESMALFTREAEKAGIKNIDGVIAVDTEVLVRLLDVIGEIGVPGFGNFSTKIDERCDCAQVIYELESFADVEGPVVWSENEPEKIVFAPPNYDNRKKIVGPLMNSVLANTLAQPKEKLPDLFQAGWELLTQKHVLFYLFDGDIQKGAEGFGIAGKMKEFDGDYLHINDANLGGRKSNLYVTQEVVSDIEVKKDGSVEKTLAITYKNSKDQDGWLNSVLPNWTRVYVPKGSELLGMDGFDDRLEPYEELGKTVFAGGFELRPQGVRKIVVKYRLPFKLEGEYNLLIQKQPGVGGPLYTINFGKRTEEFFLLTDRELKYSI